jgi:hypothetical protein
MPSPVASAAAPHVFVARADLTRLDCDAWLLPGTDDDGPRIREKWLQSNTTLAAQFVDGRMRTPHDRAAERVWRVPGGGLDGPQAYLVNTGAYGAGALDWYLEGLHQFFEVVGADWERSRPARARHRPLIGVPMLGTRRRGGHRSRAAIMVDILRELYRCADRLSADIAFVTLHDSDFSAAQWARQRLADERDPWAPLADGELGTVAERLAGPAREGRLVLFLGAGVSAGAGLPTWNELLDRLAERAGFDAQARVDLATRLPAIDRADVVKRALADHGLELGVETAAAMVSQRYSLSHALAASLPVDEFVTTNYDELFEMACEAIGRGVAQLPYHPDQDRERWLLKLHGTIAESQDIVLTRDDYLAYHDRRAALSGIVQGLLITKQLLFVGFSLTDETFHRIAHDVRKAIRPAGDEGRGREFGTAVVLDADPLRERLWAGDVRFVSAAVEPSSPLAAARRVEIFLDRLLAASTTRNQHLLDHTYDDLLEPPERELRDALLEFIERMEASPASTADAWTELEQLAHRLGRSSGD